MRLGILIGAVLTASASLASLAGASDHWLGIEMGTSIPHGAFSDDANTGADGSHQLRPTRPSEYPGGCALRAPLTVEAE